MSFGEEFILFENETTNSDSLTPDVLLQSKNKLFSTDPNQITFGKKLTLSETLDVELRQGGWEKKSGILNYTFFTSFYQYLSQLSVSDNLF